MLCYIPSDIIITVSGNVISGCVRVTAPSIVSMCRYRCTPTFLHVAMVVVCSRYTTNIFSWCGTNLPVHIIRG